MDDASRSAPAAVPRVNSSGPDPLIGRVINDRYKVVGLIARGGMGKVYRAEQAPLGRLVGLKVLNPNYTGDNDPEFHKRFFLEASIASKLTHPNTVTIFDYGRTDDDIYYIAMELLEGRTLHRALREEAPFDGERAMHIGRQVCRSLREAHGLGVIHRDLKPANIYLVQHGDEEDFVKVLDFGLVKNLEEKGEELTQTGLFMGSPKYMSPEQIRGEKVDARVDVYALGVILFEMLCGKVPFDRPNSVNILMAHIQEAVPALNELNANVNVAPPLEAVVRKAMAKNVDERYISMDEVLVALKQCAGLSTTMSGEHRVPGNATGEFDSVSLEGAYSPTNSAVQVQGELLSGGTPSAMGAVPAESIPSQQIAQAGEQSSSKTLPIILVVVAAMVLGFLVFNPTSKPDPVPAEEATAATAEQAPDTVGDPTAPTPEGEGDGTAVAPTDEATEPEPEKPAEPEPPPSVLVSLRSTPPGATVVVDDREFGPTPTQVEWTGADAEIGREVTFRFQRKGYRDLTVTRTIRGNRLEVEAPPLDPLPIRRPRPRPKPRASKPKPSKPAAPKPSSVGPVQGYKAEPY